MEKEVKKEGCGKQINQLTFCGGKWLDDTLILCEECQRLNNG